MDAPKHDALFATHNTLTNPSFRMKHFLFFCLSIAILSTACTPQKSSERGKPYRVSDLTGTYRGTFNLMTEFCNPYDTYLQACELEIKNDGKSVIRIFNGGKVEYELRGIIEDIRMKQQKNAFGEPTGRFDHSFNWRYTGGDPLKYFDSQSSWKNVGPMSWEYTGNANSFWCSIISSDKIKVGYHSKEFNRVD